jgi:GNAT superfamily N-acetyltransferase
MTNACSVNINPLIQADEQDWRRLWGAYQRFYAVELTEAIHTSTWSRLLDPVVPIFGAIARDEDGVAIGLVHHIRHATCWNTADSCYLQDLYVDEGSRGAGAGRALITHVVDAAAEYGAAYVHWLTHEANARAMRLYDDIATRSGFVQYRIAIPG